jgi:multidrug efflux pump subunit AcrA (membrane-fusion protein)
MLYFSGKTFLGIGVAGTVIVGILAVVLLAAGSQQHQEPSGVTQTESEPDDADATPQEITVRTIRPKRDTTRGITVEAPAYVEGYYRADLQARVAGPVKFIQKDIGDAVVEGERLVEIDVPDQVQEVAEKQAIVEQRKRELELSQAGAKMAQAGIVTAQNDVKKKEADVDAALAEQVFRQKEWKRFQQLAKDNAVTAIVVEEREKFYQAAVAVTASNRASVLKAQSDLEEARAKLEAAQADVKLKQALIGVSQKNRDRSQALLDFAQIPAPFDGVIIRREVGPGSFVHSATTAHTKPLLSVERIDIVTIYMKVPDNFAPFVCRNTEAIIEMTELPNQLIHAKVTRFTPSLQTPEHDRTMRVEVDLYNGNREEYERFLAKEKTIGNADLKGGVLPALPAVVGNPDQEMPSRCLLPGMYGKMQLVLRKLNNAFLVPSSAIVSRGGKPFVYEVRNGTAHLVPVEIQVDDGKLAKVAKIVQVGRDVVRQDLTGSEEIIVSNQGELSDEQPVRTTPTEW